MKPWGGSESIEPYDGMRGVTMQDRQILARQLGRALRVVRETERSLEAQWRRLDEMAR